MKRVKVNKLQVELRGTTVKKTVVQELKCKFTLQVLELECKFTLQVQEQLFRIQSSML